MRILAALFFWLLLATPAHATKILAWGDSFTYNPASSTQWPTELQALRPDLTIVNAGFPGRTSNTVNEFKLTFDAQLPQAVFILLGANDITIYNDGGTTSANNIFSMALYATSHGASAWIMTLPPIMCQGMGQGGQYTCDQHRASTKGINYSLIYRHKTPGYRPNLSLLDLRDNFSGIVYETRSDGIHPGPTALVQFAQWAAGALYFAGF